MPKLFNDSLFTAENNSLKFMTHLLQSAIENSIFVYKADGEIVLWNEGAKLCYGYEPDEVIDEMNVSSLFRAEDVKAGFPEKLKASVFQKGRWEGSIRQVRKNGEKFWSYCVLVECFKDGAGPTFLAISKDISKELRLEKLEKEHYYTRSLIEKIAAVMLVIDTSGTIIDVNEEALNLTGYSREELLGSEFTKYFIDSEKAVNAINCIYRDGHIANYEMMLRTKDEALIPTVYIGKRLYDQEGNLLGVIGVVRDLTQQKLIHNILQADNIRLRTESSAKDSFLSSMSHELRTPLNAIIGFTGTLLMGLPGTLNEEQSNQLNIIKRNAEHLLSLINDILDLATIEAGKNIVRIEQFDSQEVIRELIASFTMTALGKGIKLQVKDLNSPLILTTDKRIFKQILINLISNAIKYTEKGEVTIKVEKRLQNEDGHAIFSVLDTGIGIKNEDKKRIFQPFEQVHDANRKVSGTGLGLNLSMKLAKAIHAELEFESIYEKGSRFSLLVPLKDLSLLLAEEVSF